MQQREIAEAHAKDSAKKLKALGIDYQMAYDFLMEEFEKEFRAKYD